MRCASSIFARAQLDSAARTHVREPVWLLSRAADFWLACAGGGLLLILLAVALQSFKGNRVPVAPLQLGVEIDLACENLRHRNRQVGLFACRFNRLEQRRRAWIDSATDSGIHESCRNRHNLSVKFDGVRNRFDAKE